MPTQTGWYSPHIIEVEETGQYGILNPTNALTRDGNRTNAQNDYNYSSDQPTHKLIARDYQTDIPGGTAILGIEMRLTCDLSYTAGPPAGPARCYDHLIQLVRNGGLVGENKSRGITTPWPYYVPAGYANVIFGDTDDLWGLPSLRGVDVNDASFGIAVQAMLLRMIDSNAVHAQIDCAQFRFTYEGVTGDWHYLVVDGFFLIVMADTLVFPYGIHPLSYAWEWGDGFPDGEGITDYHRYILGGIYTVTCVVTLDDGSILRLPKQIPIGGSGDVVDLTKVSGLTGDTHESLVLDAGMIVINYGILGLERKLGATRGGAQFNLNRTIREIEVDGAKGPVEGLRRVIEVRPEIRAQMLELSAQNLIDCIAGATDTVGSSTHTIEGAEVTDASYFENVALIAKLSGSDTPIICIVKRALPVTQFNLNTVDRNEAVTEIVFAGHYDPDDAVEEPWEIIYPKMAGSGSGSGS